MRIERFVETNNLLSYKQAEFRKREECVGQVVSLVDIIQRRQNAGLNTHAVHISSARARAGSYRTHSQYRGCQQGCPLSGCCSIVHQRHLDGVAPITVPDYRVTPTP
ncbi:hypothetical protein BASA83_010469 [Batrachochytrium salamandrivorans]|nr:hypothetical protein BASA83_010469 [Batrachochytrium salamandrivorans]